MRLTSPHTLAAGVAIALSCGGGGAPHHRDLQVMSFSPDGAIDKAEQIVIRFDKPVVDEAMVSKPAVPGTVTVMPAVPWNGFWQDRQTLVIDPTERLVPSTKYTVTLQGDLAKRTRDFTMSFVHRPLSIEGLAGVDTERISPDGELPLTFNQPVNAIDVTTRCKLYGKTEVALVANPAVPAAQTVSVRPATPLEPGGEYTLRCEQLTGAGGNEPLSRHDIPLTVRPPLTVISFEPDTNNLAADEVTLQVRFSNPVTLDVARKALTSTPAIPALANGYLDHESTTYQVTTDLDAMTEYTLRVSDATDAFGQKLAKPAEHKFKTGDARARISMERGIFALEATAPGYPLWSRNVGKYEVECAAIPKDRIVTVLTTDMNYDPWGGNNDDKPIDWKTAKLKPRTTAVTTTTRGKWKLDELDLGKTCGTAAGTRGLYLAEVRSDEIVPDNTRGWLSPRRNRVLANVTDLGVLIKTGTSSGIVWVTSLASAAPIGNAKISVYTPTGKLVHTGTTNADGIAKIPGSSVLKTQPARENAEEGEYEDWDSYRSQRLIAVVEKGNDLAVVDGNWSNGIQLWNFGVTEDRRGGATKVRGFIQSDRGLYRPGEKVHFKGIAREISAGKAPRVPTQTKVDVEIQDSRGQTVLTTTKQLSGFGGFAFDLPLGEEASVGDYYVRAKVANQTFREKFSVEEFRPATFEVKLKAGNTLPRPGEKLAFELEARHLMGSPADGANVEWNLRKRAHIISFPGFDQYNFSSDPFAWYQAYYSRYYDYQDYGSFIGDGTGVTDAHGKLSIEARDPATEFVGPVDYILTTNTTDSADQTMGKSTVVTAHKTGFYMGMHANEFVQAVNMPFGVNLVALAPDGGRVSAKAKLSVIRTTQNCTWIEVGSRAHQNCEASAKTVTERDITIANAGSHTERIVPAEPGVYTIKAEAKDDRGNPVVVASQIWVIGKGEAFWSGDEGARMTLVASKPSFVTGDTARLVPQTNLVKPTALVTIERDGVIDARLAKLGSPAEGIEIKIDDAWAPNVYAGVAMVSGRRGAGDRNRPQFKMGLVELKVASTHKQLAVNVSLEKTTVRPGDKVTGKIKVTHGGNPVKAEVSLSAADEGILQLINYATPNPMKTFYASYGLGVDAGTNWNRIARLADPTKGDPDEGGDSGGSEAQQRIRSKFVSSAYWAPSLVTDANGEIAFSFTAPDNLTAFRLMAVAADKSDRFGSGDLRLTINKPLMVAPALPRFLRSGDAASVGVVVHNNTEIAGNAIVTAKATGATLDVGQQTIAVPAKGSVRVRFAAKASEMKSASFEFGIALGNVRDAVVVELPIDRPRVIDNRLIVEHKLGRNGKWTGTLGVGGDVLRGESTLTISVDRTGIGDLGPGLRSLIEYPYGCLEQTMSRFVPLVAAKDLAKTIDEKSLQGGKAEQFIRAGVAKVVRHQQGDGNFSLWPNGPVYHHLTAYALWGLTLAQKAGEEVPAEAFDKGINALKAWSNQSGAMKPNSDGAVMAMGAYVMAMRGKPDANLNARLYQLRSGLPKWGQAFLLRAMKLQKADPKLLAELQKLVETGVKLDGSKAYVIEGNATEHYHYMSSDIRASAMTLAALIDVDPNNRLIDPLAAGLKASRSNSGSWVSTQETLWSLVALGDYGRRAANGTTNAVVKVGGKQMLKKQIVGTEISTVTVPLSNISDDSVELAVDQGAAISVRVREARVDSMAPVANGFALERSYVDAAGKPITSAKAGDMVTVKLIVTAHEHKEWVALVDPIPAGLEVVNPKLAAGGTKLPTTQQPTDPWAGRHGWVVWNHQELRDDRVQWFADAMGAGTFELTYQARATIDGTFTAMPATIEAMYRPHLRARTGRSTLTVTK